MEYEGLPRDYLETYLDRIAGVTQDDVLRVAKKYIRPDKITLLVVGNEKALDTFPKEWGTFNRIELSRADSEESERTVEEK